MGQAQPRHLLGASGFRSQSLGLSLGRGGTPEGHEGLSRRSLQEKRQVAAAKGGVVVILSLGFFMPESCYFMPNSEGKTKVLTSVWQPADQGLWHWILGRGPRI